VVDDLPKRTTIYWKEPKRTEKS